MIRYYEKFFKETLGILSVVYDNLKCSILLSILLLQTYIKEKLPRYPYK